MDNASPPQKSERLLSLDAFRGITIAAMFLVNNAGDWRHVYSPLRHAEWNGCTAADLIFPFFLFIMGVAMTYSMGKRRQGAGPGYALLAPAIRRTVILSLLNAALALLAWWAFVGHFRFYGVLQRIAICYFFTSLIVLYAGVRAQALWGAGLVLGYYFILKFVPAPGSEAGMLDRFSNIADYIDTKLMLPWLYEIDDKLQMGHDPEGMLSTLGAMGTTLSGVLVGHWLRRKDKSPAPKAAFLALAGGLLAAAAALWSRDIPFNKNLWTPSYVLHASGWACLGLAASYWLIDIRGFQTWAKPFIVYGSNAIAAYVGVGAMSYVLVGIRWHDEACKTMRLKTYLYQRLYESWLPTFFSPYVSSAAWGASYVLLWCGLMWILYRRRIFIKV